MKSFMKSSLFFLLSAIIVIGCLQIFIFKGDLFKYRASIILSGSMEPKLSVDDLVFVKKTNKVKVGDVITFYDDNGKKIMHRVIDIKQDIITTQGDANNVPDKSINKNQVYGVYVGKIKHVGIIFRYIRTPIGILFCFILMSMFILLPDIKLKKIVRS